MGRKPTTENAFARHLCEENGPLYWIGDDRVIGYVNESLALWLGVAREKIEGQKGEYATAPVNDQVLLANQLCPPPDLFDGKKTQFELLLPGDSGKPRRFTAHCLHLKRWKGESQGLLVSIDPEETKTTSDRMTLAAEDLHQRVAMLRAGNLRIANVDRFLGASAAAKRIRQQIRLATESNASTLIVGPPGSGRETIARAIHAASASPARLLPILCRQLDAEMLRSMVDPASYRFPTSGDASQVLLLLEVDQLDGAAQSALLEVFRQPHPPRVLSTARQSLRALVEQGKFDTSLCDHLSVLRIESPPLSERREDIAILAQAFLEQNNVGRETQLAGFAPDAMDLLVCYCWPGNVDQLADVVRQSVESAVKPLIYASQLPERIRAARHAAEHPREAAPVPIALDELLAQIERELIEKALVLAEGNKSKAAALLSLPRSRLLRKLEQLRIESPRGGEEETELPDFRPISEFPNLVTPLDSD
jgi:DNA-binding NtrC family response regulator